MDHSKLLGGGRASVRHLVTAMWQISNTDAKSEKTRTEQGSYVKREENPAKKPKHGGKWGFSTGKLGPEDDELEAGLGYQYIGKQINK